MTNLVRVGDDRPDLELTVKNRKAQVVDVSVGKVTTLSGRIRAVGGTVDLVTRAATLNTDGVDGRVNWSFATGDFTDPTDLGDIIYWLDITFVGGDKLQSDKLYFTVISEDE